MPLRRTPPPATPVQQHTLPAPALPPLAHCRSDPNIPTNESIAVPTISREHTTSDPNITLRKRKREEGMSREDVLKMFADLKRDQDEKILEFFNKAQPESHHRFEHKKAENDILAMFAELKKDQNEKFEILTNNVQKGIQALTEQNSAILGSVDFLGQKYDELMSRINILEEEKAVDRKYIKSLETRLEHMDRFIQSSTIEVRNVPKKNGETKEDLVNLVGAVGKALNLPIQPTEVRDVYRLNTKNEQNQPILAQLSTVVLRDKIVGSVKAYNKKYASSKFNTSNLKLEGPPKPIFVSEGLTPQTKRLFFLAREFSKNNGIKYCWTSRGRVYMRRTDGAALIKVNGEEDLEQPKLT